MAEQSSANSGRALKVLSLTTLYPSPEDPGAGLFIRARLQQLGKLADICALVPVALFRYHRSETSRHRISRQFRSSWRDGTVDVIQRPWWYLPGTGPFTAICLFLWLLVPAAMLRRRFPWDLIDAHFGHPEGIAAALLAKVFRCAFTVTLRGNEVEHGRSRARRLALQWCFGNAARVITVSESLRAFAISLGANPRRVVTIPNGVDASIFHPRERIACREKNGLDPHRRVILSAGHLIELKGHHYVIRALRTLIEEGIDAELLIAGGAGNRASFAAAIHQQIEDSGVGLRVRMLGNVEPLLLAELMSAADVFCMASSREGWPNVVHEAMSCGSPVVATRVGAIPEMICSEQFGLVLPPEDIDTLAEVLKRALLKTDWDRDAIAQWARRRSWEQVALEVAAQLRAAVAERLP
jgi:teichuronic acid biosynthesis glycosyltransferase TuaC